MEDRGSRTALAPAPSPPSRRFRSSIFDFRSSILRPPSSMLFLLPLCGFLFFFRLGDRDLTSSHEARAAHDAQTILTTGDWGLPRLFHGKVELQKPPLSY